MGPSTCPPPALETPALPTTRALPLASAASMTWQLDCDWHAGAAAAPERVHCARPRRCPQGTARHRKAPPSAARSIAL